MTTRLAKFIADTGYASRREAERLILENKVQVNGIIINTPVFFVNGDEDIKVSGKKLVKKSDVKLYAFHKPLDTITSNSDPMGRKTIFDVLDKKYRNLKYVGRLDFKTTGLLLLTNDGGVSRQLTLPSNKIPRTYIARVKGDDFTGLDDLRRGITVDGIKYQPMKIEIEKNKDLKITITEGKKNELRITLKAVGLPVLKLHRLSYGNVNLGNMSVGQIIELDQKTIDELLKNP